MLRELKETKDHVLYKVHLHEMFRIGKLRARKVDWWFPRAERRGAGGKWKMTAKGYVVSFWSDENVLKLIVVMVAQLCDSTDAVKLIL